jgi:hypothetical protein
MVSALIEPQDWVMEISPQAQADARQFSRSLPTATGRWMAYLNHLCLTTCLDWLIPDYVPAAEIELNGAGLRSLWQAVNGCVITVGHIRIALIPTEAIDQTELEVPQEWIDIPEWAADYYLAVQIDGTEIRLYGYATHQQIKSAASYDPSDRTYCLDGTALNPDLNALWLSYARISIDQTRAPLSAIAPLPDSQADALILRLQNSLIPRLALPFTMWAAFVREAPLRQRLYQRPTQLGQWLQGQIDTIWQSLETVLLPSQIAIALRSPDQSPIPTSDLYRAKVYEFATGQIALVIGISPLEGNESRIRIAIHPAGSSVYLPSPTALRLLSDQGSEVGRASAAVTETIQLQFRVSPGEQFQLEITCAGQTLTEQFVL